MCALVNGVHACALPISDEGLLAALVAGVDADGERLRAKSARLLRAGTGNAWLEITLEEGRNRQIRRLLAAFDIGVLRQSGRASLRDRGCQCVTIAVDAVYVKKQHHMTHQII